MLATSRSMSDRLSATECLREHPASFAGSKVSIGRVTPAHILDSDRPTKVLTRVLETHLQEQSGSLGVALREQVVASALQDGGFLYLARTVWHTKSEATVEISPSIQVDLAALKVAFEKALLEGPTGGTGAGGHRGQRGERGHGDVRGC